MKKEYTIKFLSFIKHFPLVIITIAILGTFLHYILNDNNISMALENTIFLLEHWTSILLILMLIIYYKYNFIIKIIMFILIINVIEIFPSGKFIATLFQYSDKIESSILVDLVGKYQPFADMGLRTDEFPYVTSWLNKGYSIEYIRQRLLLWRQQRGYYGNIENAIFLSDLNKKYHTSKKVNSHLLAMIDKECSQEDIIQYAKKHHSNQNQ
jgi:hypothetical protein